MAGYTRQSAASIITGGSITAAIFNAEFNQLQAAMDATNGHNHDGSTGGGAPISLSSSVTGQLSLANGGTASNLSDPGADRIMFWDDSATSVAFADLSAGLTISATTITLDAGLQSIAGLTTAADKMIYTTASDTYATTDLSSFARTILDDADASAVRTTLGLGTIATQASNSVAITGGSITGITDLAIADGGTGASTAANARTNLGLVIGTNVQAYDADTLFADQTDNLTAGYSATVYNAGTKSSGTFTPSEANGNKQRCVNGGAFTLSPPTNHTNIELLVVNNASAGAITTSSFDKVTGDSLTTTNAAEFVLQITTTTNGSSTRSILNVIAL